ncbi:TIGD6 [Cordylochernes scorpioides]|uniref:TIGD6 n=1 Tax=Cordylochernes scorpioides TaxID=51811 RepID=A0ABY6LFR0_9ARAC|nr:TIGD6 [Cordylochernes scorpioides]
MLLGYGVQNMNKHSKLLKIHFISKPVLYIYDPSKPCHLITDASGLGVAGVLKQPDEQGILHPIAYYSRKLHPYEQNYTASEIETLAIINSLIPDRTLAHKDENCRGVKRMKQRITVLLCCNSTGTDKRRLLIIGKSAKPRCFRNFSPHFYCTYTSNRKAWMTSSIFQEWLLQFNKQLVSKGRRILLLLDNATSHCVPNDGLSNINIHFLPPNMTTSLKPLDSGIIKSFKAQYR